MESAPLCFQCGTRSIFVEFSENKLIKRTWCLKCLKLNYPLKDLLFLLGRIEVHHVVLQSDPPVEFWPVKEKSKQELKIYLDTQFSVQCPVTEKGKISVYEGFFCYNSEKMLHELFNFFQKLISKGQLILPNKKIDDDIGFLIVTFLMQEDCMIFTIDFSQNLLTPNFCDLIYGVIRKKKKLKAIDLKDNLIPLHLEIQIKNECLRNLIRDREAQYDSLFSFSKKEFLIDNSYALRFLSKLINFCPDIYTELYRITQLIDSKLLLLPKYSISGLENYISVNPKMNSQWILYRLYQILKKDFSHYSKSQVVQLDISDYNCESITLFHSLYCIQISFTLSISFNYCPLYLNGKIYFARVNSSEFYVGEIPPRDTRVELILATPRPLRQERVCLLPTENGGIVSIGYSKNILTVLLYEISKNKWSQYPQVPFDWKDLSFSVDIYKNDFLTVVSMKKAVKLDLMDPEQGWIRSAVVVTVQLGAYPEKMYLKVYIIDWDI